MTKATKLLYYPHLAWMPAFLLKALATPDGALAHVSIAALLLSRAEASFLSAAISQHLAMSQTSALPRQRYRIGAGGTLRAGA